MPSHHIFKIDFQQSLCHGNFLIQPRRAARLCPSCMSSKRIYPATPAECHATVLIQPAPAKILLVALSTDPFPLPLRIRLDLLKILLLPAASTIWRRKTGQLPPLPRPIVSKLTAHLLEALLAIRDLSSRKIAIARRLRFVAVALPSET